MPTRIQVSFSLCLLAGCGGQSPLDPLYVPAVSTAARAEPGSRACRSVGAGQFDFWLGAWAITATGDGAAAGVSEVTRTLSGCAVEEYFTAANGASGRSINLFDRHTRRWHQAFVGVFGQNFRLTGGPTPSAAMELSGARSTLQGTNPSRIVWTVGDSGQVRQVVSNSFDGGQSFVTGFDGTYRRVDAVSRPPALLPGICPRIGAYRQFDFALGDWDVSRPDGTPVGRSRITAELDGCLIVERDSIRAGRASLSYFFFDLGTGGWVRVYGDSRGRVLELTARPVEDGWFALGGSGADGSGAEVLNLWRREPDGTLLQRWTRVGQGEHGGATLVYRPRT